MHTDLKFMTVMQWMSPAFPIGAFAYSHGLEWAIDKGHVSNGKKLQNWIADLLEYGSLRTDAIFISLILRGHDAKKMNELSIALCPAGERLLETKLQGSAFAKVIEDVWQQEDELLLGKIERINEEDDNLSNEPKYLDLWNMVKEITNHPEIKKLNLDLDLHSSISVCYILASVLPLRPQEKQTILEFENNRDKLDYLKVLIKRLGG